MRNMIAVLLLCVLYACSTGERKFERPREVWVFRSALNEQPRILTVALNKDLWVAYDVQNALLFKAWKGDVNFDGTVYTTVHRIQPTTKGFTYFDKEDDVWVLYKDGEAIKPQIEYLGHQFDKGQVTLNYTLITPEGQRIDISETPEFVKKDSIGGLQRVFKVDNGSQYEVGVKTKIGALEKPTDYSFSGKFIKNTKEKVNDIHEVLFEVSGTFLFTKKTNELTVYYHPEIENFKQDISYGEDPENALSNGSKLIQGSDCEACHNEKIQTVGPSYLDIASRYDDSDQSLDILSQKIIKGGTGAWGKAMMSPHTDLSVPDAKEMVRYILSLDDNKKHNNAKKFSLGQKSVSIRLEENMDQRSGKGFAVHAYFNNEGDDGRNIVKSNPVKQGYVNKIHTLGAGDFDEFREYFAMKFSGKINIPKTGSYVFRLVSDDNSFLFINNKLIIDNGGNHKVKPLEGEVFMVAGNHEIEVIYAQGRKDALVSLQWYNDQTKAFELVDDTDVSFDKGHILETKEFTPPDLLVKNIPGDKGPLNRMHPSFDLHQARPADFKPRVGGIDFLSDGRMVLCTWDADGSAYIVEGWETGDSTRMSVKRIATGLAEPLGLKVVDNEIYVLQKQELTLLVDTDGDEITDEYRTISDDWRVTANYHEFAFGLLYKDGYFYATLASGLGDAPKYQPDRGRAIKIDRKSGEVEFIAHGFRTPNGIGFGPEDEVFIADNQGKWMPASKIIHVQKDRFYGFRDADLKGTEGLEVTPPTVWLPQNEIGNSPSTPIMMKVGPYKGQMLFCEVTHGGVKRVFLEKVNGEYQGAAFRFAQGMEAGINRMAWAPDTSLIVGGIGSAGNWGQMGNGWYGLQRLKYNSKSTFEILSVSARTNGFELEFTEPIAEGQNICKEDFEVSQWYYIATKDYGGPKRELESLPIESIYLSEDRKRVFLKLTGLKKDRVVYVHIIRPFRSSLDHELWTTESWYTLNNIPENNPGFENDYNANHNRLTASEKADGWQLLFDGKSTKEFRNYNSAKLEEWSVQDSALYFTMTSKDVGSDLILSEKEFENFELSIEWKISKGGNSGIIYHVAEDKKHRLPWFTGPEYQILDNVRHKGGQVKTHRAGDLYDLIDSRLITFSGAEEWNRARIVVNNGHVEHWLNGYKVVDYEMWDDQMKDLISKSKFTKYPDYGKSKKGLIALQDHNHDVWFRNIKIKEL